VAGSIEQESIHGLIIACLARYRPSAPDSRGNLGGRLCPDGLLPQYPQCLVGFWRHADEAVRGTRATGVLGLESRRVHEYG
jgi:hypothetical protein